MAIKSWRVFDIKSPKDYQYRFQDEGLKMKGILSSVFQATVMGSRIEADCCCGKKEKDPQRLGRFDVLETHLFSCLILSETHPALASHVSLVHPCFSPIRFFPFNRVFLFPNIFDYRKTSHAVHSCERATTLAVPKTISSLWHGAW